MKLKIKIPEKSINKAFLKDKVNRIDFENFKTQLQIIVNKKDDDESEEHLKNFAIQFFKNTFYRGNEVNTKGRTDLAIYNGVDNKSTVGIIFETKKPANKADMITKNDINKKALHEIILYYLRERIEHENNEIKNIIITNIDEWFVFDAIDFERFFFNSKLKQEYKKWKTGQKTSKNTDLFYTEIAKKFITQNKNEIECTYINFTDFKNIDKVAENKLINLYKLFSPEHLLKLPHVNDSNTLDNKFYNELLHIIGLQEEKGKNKKIISRLKISERQPASLLENTIKILYTENRLKHIDNLEKDYGKKQEEQLFNVALELSIIWINRILFLKLLEAQLLQYHRDNTNYEFLNIKTIADLNELNELFFEVLAQKTHDRDKNIKEKFKIIPYLNSSLFEISKLEDKTIRISNLKERFKLPVLSSSVIKEKKELPILEYIFDFLNCYDFTSEGASKIQEENKNLINASVLGLIFEKINGYKEGAYFTPGHITMYMTRENIRKSVLQKFKETNLPKFQTLSNFEEIKDKIEDRKQANKIVNNLKICDPSVGSGHFLVSALNEIIAIKSELGILEYQNGNRIKNYKIEIINDEIIVTDKETDELFEYNLSENGNIIDYKQDLQEALFQEKQTIIENCLFGVDINPNSVNITRLRLWIEILKNSYYAKKSNYTELETLPNIDINIKQGNSLVSKFALTGNEISNGQVQKMRLATQKYKDQVIIYKSTNNKVIKQKVENEILKIKQEFAKSINPTDKDFREIRKLQAELAELTNRSPVLMTKKDKDTWQKSLNTLPIELNKLEKQYQEKLETIYGNAFEWRFEFPEILDKSGNFVGFDLIIGNPPYIDSEYMVKYDNDIRNYLKNKFQTTIGNWDIFIPFVEFAFSILKKDGNFSYIIPNKILGAKYSKHLIQFLLNKKIETIRDYSRENIFSEADVYPVVISVANSQALKNDKLFFEPMKNINQVKYTNIISYQEVKNDPNLDKYFTEKQTLIIIDKLRKHNKLEQYVSLISDASTVSEAYLVKEKIIDNPNITEEFIKIINTGTIDPYKILWGEKPMQYIKNKYKNPCIKITDLISINKKRQEQAFSNKIIVAGMSKIIEAVFDTGKILAAKSTNIIIDNDTNKLKFIIGILNSKLISFYVTNYYHSNKMAGNYINISPRLLKAIPIPYIVNKDIISKVNKIIDLKQENINKDIVTQETEINKLVYRIYKLTNQEIEHIENYHKEKI